MIIIIIVIIIIIIVIIISLIFLEEGNKSLGKYKSFKDTDSINNLGIN
jgi:hypothetical protein